MCQCLGLTTSHKAVHILNDAGCISLWKRPVCDLYITTVIFPNRRQENYRDDDKSCWTCIGVKGRGAWWSGSQQNNAFCKQHSREGGGLKQTRGVSWSVLNIRVEALVCSQYSLLSFTESLWDAFPQRPVQYFKSFHKSKQMVNKDAISWAFVATHFYAMSLWREKFWPQILKMQRVLNFPIFLVQGSKEPQFRTRLLGWQTGPPWWSPKIRAILYVWCHPGV